MKWNFISDEKGRNEAAAQKPICAPPHFYRGTGGISRRTRSPRCCRARSTPCLLYTSSHDIEQFREIKETLEAKCPDLIVQLSTGGRYDASEEDRDNALRCLPEMISYCPGSSAFPTGAYVNRVEYYTAQAKFMLEHNIKPEIEVFDTNMMSNAINLHKDCLLYTSNRK